MAESLALITIMVSGWVLLVLTLYTLATLAERVDNAIRRRQYGLRRSCQSGDCHCMAHPTGARLRR